jgi:hypothetical protein
MHRIERIVFALAASIVVLGCSVASVGLPAVLGTATAAPVASGTAGPAAMDTTAPTEPAASFTPVLSVPGPEGATGLSVSYRNLALAIPDGLSTDTTNSTSTDVEFPYINPSNGDMPEHIKILLKGYPIQGTIHEPQIEVFSASAYAQYTDLTRQIISTLQNSPFLDGQPLPAGLPDGAFSAHVQTVEFANGRGIRYLRQFNQAPLPVNNRELIYYFHGLTNDCSTYVEVILPLQAAFLAPDDNPASPLPGEGIPFNMDDVGSYFQAVADRLDATARASSHRLLPGWMPSSNLSQSSEAHIAMSPARPALRSDPFVRPVWCWFVGVTAERWIAS